MLMSDDDELMYRLVATYRAGIVYRFFVACHKSDVNIGNRQQDCLLLTQIQRTKIGGALNVQF